MLQEVQTTFKAEKILIKIVHFLLLCIIFINFQVDHDWVLSIYEYLSIYSSI